MCPWWFMASIFGPDKQYKRVHGGSCQASSVHGGSCCYLTRVCPLASSVQTSQYKRVKTIAPKEYGWSLAKHWSNWCVQRVCMANKQGGLFLQIEHGWASKPLELIHVDNCGPKHTRSLGGNMYLLLLQMITHAWIGCIFLVTSHKNLNILGNSKH